MNKKYLGYSIGFLRKWLYVVKNDSSRTRLYKLKWITYIRSRMLRTWIIINILKSSVK